MTGYYPYDLYDTCYLQGDLMTTQPRLPWVRARNNANARVAAARRRLWGHGEPPAPNQGAGVYPCGSTKAYYIWLNDTRVRAALHVPQDMYFEDADGDVSWFYAQTEKDLRPWFKEVAEAGALDILVYSGARRDACRYGEHFRTSAEN